MRAHRTVQLFRLLLISTLGALSLNCEEAEDCGCLDAPPALGDDDDTGADGEEIPPVPEDLLQLLSVLPACEGGIVPAFADEEIAPPAAGSDGYLAPGPDTLEAIASSVESLEAGDSQLAFALVAVVGYELCHGQEEDEGVVLWRPSTPGTGRALFAYRMHAAEPIQVGAPHPWQHATTLGAARMAFRRLRARTLVVAGTHRCASLDSSGCAGDEACGPEPALSDMSYSRDTVYQAAQELFADAFEADLVIALDGQTDGGVVVSEGVTQPIGENAPASRIVTSLALDGERVMACGDGTAAPVVTTACGLDNVQGLYVNGSPVACGPATPGAAVGRFVHLSLGPDVDREVVVDALADVLE